MTCNDLVPDADPGNVIAQASGPHLVIDGLLPRHVEYEPENFTDTRTMLLPHGFGISGSAVSGKWNTPTFGMSPIGNWTPSKRMSDARSRAQIASRLCPIFSERDFQIAE